jgi:hypothetical protein
MLPHVGLVYGNALDNAVFARYYAVSKSIEYYIKKEKEKSQANVQSIRIIIGTPTSEKDSQTILSKKSFNKLKIYSHQIAWLYQVKKVNFIG